MAFLKSIWRSNSKHKKLSEEWALAGAKELEAEGELAGGDGGVPADGVNFVVKYLGSTLVETPSSETATADAIKTVITMAKASGRKLPRVALSVSLRGIRMVDLATDELHLDISIYRISYCSADATYDHVFAFIATNTNETMECHAFLCPKRKMAQAVTLTVAQSFNTAYEIWQMAEGSSGINVGDKKLGVLPKPEEITENLRNRSTKDCSLNKNLTESKSLLIDFSEPESHPDNGNSWVCFDDDRTDNLNSSFSRLTTSPLPQKPLAMPSLSSPQHHMSVLAAGSHNSSSGGSHPWGESPAINLLCS